MLLVIIYHTAEKIYIVHHLLQHSQIYLQLDNLHTHFSHPGIVLYFSSSLTFQ